MGGGGQPPPVRTVKNDCEQHLTKNTQSYLDLWHIGGAIECISQMKCELTEREGGGAAC